MESRSGRLRGSNKKDRGQPLFFFADIFGRLVERFPAGSQHRVRVEMPRAPFLENAYYPKTSLTGSSPIISGMRCQALISAWAAPAQQRKSFCKVLAHIKKHTEASRKMLAVTAIANLSPVELALRHSASLAMERTVSAALQASG
jgi:hypothetical protein